MAVFMPNWAQRMAATYPPGPEPITATSYEFINYFYLKICFVYYHDNKAKPEVQKYKCFVGRP
ncbi:hypothetical protein GCM10023330_18620 [Litoribaculum gwangyangense]|uniref:Uncharacterized protein n=1 Tax=Litoribaculum gwangyangense TaxID=1130722 RepID=A0ABP9CL59_9FLAO